MNMRTMTFLALSVITIGMTGCGDSKSSSSSGSYSNPSTSGLTSDQKDRYNNLSSDGKKHFDQQMRAYDNANKK